MSDANSDGGAVEFPRGTSEWVRPKGQLSDKALRRLDYRERPDTRLLTEIDFSETAVGPS